jgi:hypothetical protein
MEMDIKCLFSQAFCVCLLIMHVLTRSGAKSLLPSSVSALNLI